MSMVEKVARAVCGACEERPDSPGDCRGNQARWQDYVPVARAAIEAMREPTFAMEEAGRRSRGKSTADALEAVGVIFADMIDAALKEQM